jgi:hypothetical protein
MVITDAIHQHVLQVSASAWTPTVEADGEIRDGAWAAELTGDVLDGWPKGMRLTCFAINTAGRPIAEFKLRHRL